MQRASRTHGCAHQPEQLPETPLSLSHRHGQRQVPHAAAAAAIAIAIASDWRLARRHTQHCGSVALRECSLPPVEDSRRPPAASRASASPQSAHPTSLASQPAAICETAPRSERSCCGHATLLTRPAQLPARGRAQTHLTCFTSAHMHSVAHNTHRCDRKSRRSSASHGRHILEALGVVTDLEIKRIRRLRWRSCWYR
jgi:hypothetical protein